MISFKLRNYLNVLFDIELSMLQSRNQLVNSTDVGVNRIKSKKIRVKFIEFDCFLFDILLNPAAHLVQVFCVVIMLSQDFFHNLQLFLQLGNKLSQILLGPSVLELVGQFIVAMFHLYLFTKRVFTAYMKIFNVNIFMQKMFTIRLFLFTMFTQQLFAFTHVLCAEVKFLGVAIGASRQYLSQVFVCFVSIFQIHRSTLLIIFLIQNSQVVKMQNSNTSLQNCRAQQSCQKLVQSHQIVQPRRLNPQGRVRKLDIYSIFIDEPLGQGYSSIVYRGINTLNNEQVSIKIVDYLSLKHPGDKQLIENEIKILKKLNSNNVLKCLDVLESKDFLYIITEFCEQGDLFRQLQFKKYFKEQELFQLVRGIANGLLELKQKDIIHRDIKPSNILLQNCVPKIADFGFAVEASKIKEKELNIGSPLYMSIEVLKQNRYSFASDVFALGVLCYELLHKVTPWESDQESELLRKIENQPLKFQEGLSSNIRELITGCLQHDISKRLTIEQILSHPFLQAAI